MKTINTFFAKNRTNVLTTLGKYGIKLTHSRMFLLLLIIVLSTCCISLYGLTRFREGLVPKRGVQNENVPDGVLEPGTGLSMNNNPSLDDGTNTIRRSEIPPGDEDLYILKSQIVPPVCPKCPTVINKCENNEKKCPPCPACARCPEPNFECKKVPNYRPTNNTLPMPLLNDFSQF